jgi:hypothetical protein
LNVNTFQEVEDKLYQNIKTGELKTLPLPVYNYVRRYWREVTRRPEPPKPAAPVVKLYEDDVKPTLEQLRAKYTELTGLKPDGRWNEARLLTKIDEQKGQ